jgi:cobalamin biosynthesis protein CobT
VRRRTVLLAIAVVAATTASTAGTAGFSSVTADRGVTVSVADDDAAFLGIDREATNVSDGRTDLVVGLTNRLPGVDDLLVTVSVVGDDGGDGDDGEDGAEDDADDEDDEDDADDADDGNGEDGDAGDEPIDPPRSVALDPGETARVTVSGVDCDAAVRVEAVTDGTDADVRIVANRRVPCP